MNKFYTLVSPQDQAKLDVAKDAKYVKIQELILGSRDGNTFTTAASELCDPDKRPWFVALVEWTNPLQKHHKHQYGPYSLTDRVATDGEIFTYVKQSIAGARIPFTDDVKQIISRRIEEFWRKQA